jgi:hypothetical protein
MNWEPQYVANENLIQEEIKRRLNPDNVCCHSVQNLPSYSLLYKNLNIETHEFINLPVILGKNKEGKYFRTGCRG